MTEAGRCPRVDQDGDVDADDNQKQAGEHAHAPEAVRRVPAHPRELVGVGQDLRPEVLVGVRKLGGHPFSDDRQLRIRVGQAAPRREATRDEYRRTLAALDFRQVDFQWSPEAMPHRKREPVGHDAHDGVDRVPEPYVPADNVAGRGEA